MNRSFVWRIRQELGVNWRRTPTCTVVRPKWRNTSLRFGTTFRGFIVATYETALHELVLDEQRRLLNDIRTLEQKKFATHQEIDQRDAEVASKRAQLLRVEDAQVSPDGVLQKFECPVCYIREARHVQFRPVGVGEGDDPEPDRLRCADCDSRMEYIDA